MMRWVVGLGLLTMAVGIGVAGYGVWTIWSQHRAITSARPTMAKVLDHQTKDLKGGGFVAKVPLVKYEYTVDQQPYTSDTVTPDELMLPDTWAESVFAQFPIGAQVEAKYDPSNPSRAFLIGKYSVKPYLPLLVGLVIAALGLGVVGEQLTSLDAPLSAPLGSGSIALLAQQHHLAQARVYGIIGLIGLIGGVPAVVHHLLVSTPPYERMGFLLEGAYGIAVLTVLAISILRFRQGAGFGTPAVVVDRAPTIGQPLQLTVAVPTRFNGAADLNACLKCEAKDTALFNLGEEKPDTVLLEQHYSLAQSQAVSPGGELAGTAALFLPDLPPSTPAEAGGTTRVVWSLLLTASATAGRKAETEYILLVNAPHET